jgi:hypothetical protein
MQENAKMRIPKFRRIAIVGLSKRTVTRESPNLILASLLRDAPGLPAEYGFDVLHIGNIRT